MFCFLNAALLLQTCLPAWLTTLTFYPVRTSFEGTHFLPMLDVCSLLSLVRTCRKLAYAFKVRESAHFSISCAVLVAV